VVAVTGDEMATITATQQRVVNNHLTNFNYHHLSSVIKYLNNQQQHQQQQPIQQKTWTTTNALSISQRYFEKIAPASVGIPALMNQNFYDMQVWNFIHKYFKVYVQCLLPPNTFLFQLLLNTMTTIQCKLSVSVQSYVGLCKRQE